MFATLADGRHYRKSEVQSASRVIALGYLHEAHADWPFTQQFLDGKRFWIAVSFLGFRCAMVASELRNWLAKRRARAAG